MIGTKYGDCYIRPNNLIKRRSVSIQSASNKTEYFINQAREVHGDKYDYSKTLYGKNQRQKVIIVCYKHHEFLQFPYNHLSGEGCFKCGVDIRKLVKKFTNQEFIERAKLVHGNLYDYSLTEYKGIKESVIIICKIHDIFIKGAESHLLGSGCQECSNLNVGFNRTSFVNASKKNGAKIYLLKFFNELTTIMT